MFRLQFELGGVPDSPNRGSKNSWQARHAHVKKWKNWVGVRCLGHKPPSPLERSILTLTRHSSVEPDPDNLAASFKPVIDGLREAGIIVNDRSSNVSIFFRWSYCAPGEKKITVRVEEIE